MPRLQSINSWRLLRSILKISMYYTTFWWSDDILCYLFKSSTSCHQLSNAISRQNPSHAWIIWMLWHTFRGSLTMIYGWSGQLMKQLCPYFHSDSIDGNVLCLLFKYDSFILVTTIYFFASHCFFSLCRISLKNQVLCKWEINLKDLLRQWLLRQLLSPPVIQDQERKA